MHVEGDNVYLTVDDAAFGIVGAKLLVDPELAKFLNQKLKTFDGFQSDAMNTELSLKGIKEEDIPGGEYANMLNEDAENVPVISLPFAGKTFVEKLASAIQEGRRDEQEGLELKNRTQAAETPELAKRRAAEYEKRDVGYKPNLRIIQGGKSRKPDISI